MKSIFHKQYNENDITIEVSMDNWGIILPIIIDSIIKNCNNCLLLQVLSIIWHIYRSFSRKVWRFYLQFIDCANCCVCVCAHCWLYINLSHVYCWWVVTDVLYCDKCVVYSFIYSYMYNIIFTVHLLMDVCMFTQSKRPNAYLHVAQHLSSLLYFIDWKGYRLLGQKTKIGDSNWIYFCHASPKERDILQFRMMRFLVHPW